MELREIETGFRVVDSVSTCLDVETDGWAETDDAPPVTETLRDRINGPDDPDLVVSGRTRGLSFPNVLVQLIDVDDDSVRHFSATNEHETVTPGRYLLKIGTPIRAFIRVDGQPEVRRVIGEQVEVAFQNPTAVSIAFEESVDGPDTAVEIPETIEGVAAGLSTFGSAACVTSADRSWPSVRNHPPLLQFGEEKRVPDAVQSEIPDTGIELTVPRTLGHVLASASVAYYLGTSVTVEDNCDPRLDLDGRTVSLGASSPLRTHDSVDESAPASTAAVASRCSRLLRRTLVSDCLVREAGPYGNSIALGDAERDLGVDSERLYDAPLSERVGHYLDAPFEKLHGSLPPWSVALSVEPQYEAVPTISRLAHTLPAIAPAEGTTISPRGSGSRTPAEKPTLRTDGDGSDVESARSSEASSDPQSASTNYRVHPTHNWGNVHGWLADGVPVEGFDALADGFENRDQSRASQEDTPSIRVVLNGTDDHEELSGAVEHYRRRTARLGLDVSILTDLSVAELARTFERETDLLHFVGHRNDRGFECRDGYFSVETLTTSNARAFFLNACNSHPAGVTLVEKGSVAGGVTTRDVIDEMAAEVGVSMARLLADGFSVAEAMTEARQNAVVSSDYLVVGDGTHVVTQSDSLASKQLSVSRPDRTVGGADAGGEQFTIRSRLTYPRNVGAVSSDPLDGSDPDRRLFGQPREYDLSLHDLVDYLEGLEFPLWYDGKLSAPEVVIDQISS